MHLPLYLKGEASATYDELSADVKDNWQDLVDTLAQKFGVGESAHTYRRTLQARKQREGESFAEFAQSLANMADKAYPTAGGFTDAVRRNMILSLFLNGIKISIRVHLDVEPVLTSSPRLFKLRKKKRNYKEKNNVVASSTD